MDHSAAMHIPDNPPDFDDLLMKVGPKRLFGQILKHISGMVDSKGRYLHWDQLQHKKPTPADLSHEEWWLGLRFVRKGHAKNLPFKCTRGNRFSYALPDPILETLHEIDQRAGGHIQMPDEITNPEMKDRYYVSSLFEESITSSILEGAATTRKIARNMIRTGRKPKDHNERMIINNYLTMKQIESLQNKDLSFDLIMELHRSMTAGTLDSAHEEGRLRGASDNVVIDDMYGHVYHTPPSAELLKERMEAMCKFANGDSPEYFVHPVIRSIILHFWLAYDHPFTDGNGRTARALFYWSMLHHGYWLFEFISISSVILDTPRKYARAFLFTETDDNDLTYFLLYHVDIIKKAIKRLHQYIQKKSESLRLLEGVLHGIVDLNYRQRALLSHALSHPDQYYTIKSHMISHGVVYQTARTDLIDLADRGLLTSRKIGRTWNYRAVPMLESVLRKLR